MPRKSFLLTTWSIINIVSNLRRKGMFGRMLLFLIYLETLYLASVEFPPLIDHYSVFVDIYLPVAFGVAGYGDRCS